MTLASLKCGRSHFERSQESRTVRTLSLSLIQKILQTRGLRVHNLTLSKLIAETLSLSPASPFSSFSN